MTIHDIAPSFMRIRYVRATTVTHHMVLPVLFADPPVVGVAPELLQKNAVPETFANSISNLMSVMRPFFSSLVDFIFAEAWSKPDVGSDPTLIWTEQIGLTGTHASAAVVTSQYVLTNRTLAGNISRIFLMEPSLPANIVSTWPFGAGIELNLANYLKGTTSVVTGRDNAYIYQPIRSVTKLNDALRKKLLLDL